MGESTLHVLGILEYYVLRDWGIYIGGACPWCPGILCIEGLGIYMEECTWDVLGIPGYYVLRDWGIYMEGCTWDVLGILGYYVLRDWGGSIWGKVPGMSLVSRDTMY